MPRFSHNFNEELAASSVKKKERTRIEPSNGHVDRVNKPKLKVKKESSLFNFNSDIEVMNALVQAKLEGFNHGMSLSEGKQENYDQLFVLPPDEPVNSPVLEKPVEIVDAKLPTIEENPLEPPILTEIKQFLKPDDKEIIIQPIANKKNLAKPVATSSKKKVTGAVKAPVRTLPEKKIVVKKPLPKWK